MTGTVTHTQDTTLFSALLGARRRHGGKTIAVEDADGQKLSYDRLVLASLILGEQLCRGSRRRETIGLLLPNVGGLVIALLGLNAFGRVAALLNFTAGPRNLHSAINTALIRTVVTSRRFVQVAKLDSLIDALQRETTHSGQPVRIVFLEDVRAGIGMFDKLQGSIRSLVAERFHRRQRMALSDPAVVLFTSGTEGLPKGVVLTNGNLTANSRQIFAHANGALSPADIVLNPLPTFHSFGLTASTLMPLFNGLKVVLYPNPLHYAEVARLILSSGATVLMATDTFLNGYIRAAKPGELNSIRLVVAGAEAVKDDTRRRWAELGTEILEGYGATECSPVISYNLPGSNRFGTVGRVLPEIETEIVPVPGHAEGGRLRVRGPNVMAGYLTSDNPGVIARPQDGWHDTGDIVTIDDGYITIKGRARRFAKIAGEMVSLSAIEMLASRVWPQSKNVVVSLADARRGEQLVLVTDATGCSLDALRERARLEGFSELWIPKAIIPVEEIPVLGTGKVDLTATTALAEQARGRA